MRLMMQVRKLFLVYEEGGGRQGHSPRSEMVKSTPLHCKPDVVAERIPFNDTAISEVP